MSNTTSNIKNEYTSLANRGNLHDFTVSELYDVGKAEYRADESTRAVQIVREGETYTFNKIEAIGQDSVPVSEFYYARTLPTQDGTYYVPFTEQAIYPIPTPGSTETFYCWRTYHITLDANLSTGLYSNYAQSHTGTALIDFTYKTDTVSYDGYANIPANVLNLYNWDTFIPSTTNMVNSIFSEDYHDFNNFVSNTTSNIFSLMTTSDTPLATLLDQSYSSEVEHRYFKSINVTASKDNVFYKIINSNPEDNIDKLVLFTDPNERSGNNLYSTKDWAPYGSEVKIEDENGLAIEPGTPITATDDLTFKVPADFNELVQMPLYPVSTMSSWSNLAKFVYSQIIQIRFKRMYVGNYSAPDHAVLGYAKAVADINCINKKEYQQHLFDTTHSVYTNYITYYSDWYYDSSEIINISANGNVVLTWTSILGVPSTLTISNWTSKLSVVNPQHLEKSDKRVLTPEWLNNFTPYKLWHQKKYGSTPSGEINPSRSKEWFNTLSSDQFNFWINPTDWSSMTYHITDTEDVTIQKGTASDQWNGINHKYIASCGGYDEIIWGCGLTPDFMYPVVDISRPTPNTSTECLVYTNDSGYNSIKLAFINSPVEDYLVARFKPSVNSIRQGKILDEINEWASKNMIFPNGTKVAFFKDDASNVLNCSGFRIAYIPRLVGAVQTVSTVLCVFIGILCLVICFVIIKRYVENNRINIGIMRANGIKKWKIALSLFPFAFLPALVGGIAAYVTGLLLQAPMLLLFKSYWMLPTPLFGFDWISFLACIFAPFLVFTLICFVSTYIVLRTSAVDLMKAGSEFKTNGFSRIAKKPFKHFGVLTRFRVSLAFNSITRLLILAAMSCLTMSSLVFAMTTFDKLSQSQNINSTQFNYDFNVELTTPTSSGGPYSVYDYSEPLSEGSDQIKGYGYADPSQYLFNIYWNTCYASYQGSSWYTTDGEQSYHQLTKPYMDDGFIEYDSDYRDAIGNNGLLMMPSAADATGQNTDLLYLQNKRSSRLTLNYEIGLPGVASSNPWEIALALMPANSRNLAADAFSELTNFVGHKVAEAEEIYKKEYPGIYDPIQGIYYRPNPELATQAAVIAGPYCHLYNFVDIFDNDYEPIFHRYFIYDEKIDTYSLDTSPWTVGIDPIPTKFRTSFISLLNTIYQDPEALKLEYPIEYGSIPLNWDLAPDEKKDETYTYINGFIKKLSTKASFDSANEIKVEGIRKDSNYVKLSDKKGHSLNERLWSENYLQSANIDNETTYPIVINSYVAHKYKLKVNDTITINISNSVQRFEPTYKKDNDNVTFKVVGISVGTSNEAYYTTQDVANDLLGLPNGSSWNKTHKYMMWTRFENSATEIPGWTEGRTNTVPALADLSGLESSDNSKISIYEFTRNNNAIDYTNDPLAGVINTVDKLSEVDVPIGFNGIYTHNKTGKPITAGLALYSYTGMYPGTSVFRSQSDVNKFAEILGFGPNLAIANIMTGLNKPEYFQACYLHLQNGTPIPASTISTFIDDVATKFGDTTMVTAICGAMDVAASDLIYNNLISTFNMAETTIMAVIIPITIIIVAVISNLIINDSKRMAAMLKALGYSDVKNLMSILALFVPTIVIGLGLAVPLAFGLTLGYQSIIFNTANILVDVTQKWWYYVAAVGGIGIILVGTYAIGYVSLKRSRLVDEIK